MALPYLMEYPYECSEQAFNRLYANSLAQHIAGSDPKIKKVFKQWKGTAALDSPLEKNQDLKAVTIEETPWFRQAESESKARRNVGILFDENRLNDETAATMKKLADLQLPDGAWSWFPGCPLDDFITLCISTGFGRLRHLGVKIDTAMAVKSLAYRGSGVEPINVISRYKMQDGLGYYESTRDTASHFFISYLPKGTYVFEYATRVVHKGKYQTGMASIQCMYAPEFNSHSESLPLEAQ
jgi:hypothetical protein